MTDIYRWDNKILLDDGKVASAEACCCDQPCATDVGCFNGETGGAYKATLDGMGDGPGCTICDNLNGLYTVSGGGFPITFWSVNLPAVCSWASFPFVISDAWFLTIEMSCTDGVCRLDGAVINNRNFSTVFPPGTCGAMDGATESHLFSHVLPAGQVYQPLNQYTLTHDLTAFICSDTLGPIACANCPPQVEQKCDATGQGTSSSSGGPPDLVPATIVMDFTAP
jgi:hypothetical protein